MKQGGEKRSHSWWWHSHISPKNSKWLEENLEGMDVNVKTMLKLIEEDGDSFAKKAEMYYKKRPELVNHVEEFYRMYRSLAERYDHLTDELKKNIPSSVKNQAGLSDDLSPSSHDQVKKKKKHRAAVFGFLHGSSSTDHSKKSEDSSEDSSSSSSDSELESEKSQDPYLELMMLKEKNDKQSSELKKALEDNEVLQQKSKELHENILQLKEDNEVLRTNAIGESGSIPILEEQIAMLQTRNTELESQIKSMIVQVEESAELNGILQKEDEKLTEELQTRSRRVQELEMDFQHLQKKLHASQEENDALKIECDRCQHNSENTELRISEMENGISAQQSQMRTLEAEIDDMKHKLAMMHEENNQLIVQNDSGIQKLNTAEAEIRHLEDEILKIEGEKDKLSMEKGDITNEASCQLESLQNQIRQLDQELHSKNITVEVMKKHIDELQQTTEKHGMLQISLRDLEEENVQLQTELGNAREVVQKYEQEAEFLKTEKAELESELTSSRRQFLNLKSKCQLGDESADQKNLIEEVLDIQQLILNMKEENMHLKSESHKRVEDSEKYKTELEELQNKLIHVSSENDSLKLEILKLQGEKYKLSMENGDITNKASCQLESLQNQIKQLEQELQSKNITVEVMKKHMDELQQTTEKYGMLQISLRDLEEENAQLQTELGNAREVVQKYEHEAQFLKTKKAELESELTSSRQQFLILKSKCQLGDESADQKKLIEEVLDIQQFILNMKEENRHLKSESDNRVEDSEKFKTELEELQNKLIYVTSENDSLKLERAGKEQLVEKLDGDIAYLQTENLTLKKEISNAVAQVQALEDECRWLRNKMEESVHLKDENLMLQNSVQVLQQDNENLKHDIIKSLKDRADMLQRKNENLETELKELCLQKGKLEGDRSSLTELKVELEEQVASWSAAAEKLDKDIVQLRQENSRLESLVGKQNMDMENLRIEIENSKHQITEVSSTHQRGLEELVFSVKRIQELQEKLSELEVENNQLNDQVSVKLDMVQNLEKQVSSLEEEKLSLNSVVGSLRDQVQKLQLLVNDLNDSKEKASQALVNDHEHSQRLEIMVQDLQDLNMNLKLEKTNIEADYQSVSEELRACKNKLERMKEEYSQLSDERNCLLSDIASKTAFISDLEQKLDRFDVDVQKLQEALKNQQKENVKLKAEYETVREELLSLQRRSKDLEDEKMTFEQESVVLKSEIGSLTEQIKNLQSLLCELNEDKEKSSEARLQDHEHIQSLEVALKEMEQLNKDIGSEKHSLEAEYQIVSEQLKRLQEEYCVLSDQRDSLVSEVSIKGECILNLEEELASLRQGNSLKVDENSSRVDFGGDLKDELCELEAEKSKIGTESLNIVNGVESAEKMQDTFNNVKEENTSLNAESQIGRDLFGQKMVEDLQIEKSDLEGQFQNLLDDHSKAEENVKLLQKQLSDSEEVNNRLKSNASSVTKKLKEEMTKLEVEKSNLQSEMSFKINKIESLKKELANVNVERSNLKVQLEVNTKYTLKLELEIGRLQNHLSRLEEKNKTSFDEKDAFETRIRDLLQDVYRLQKEKDELQQEASEKTEGAKKLEVIINTLEEDKENLKVQVNTDMENISLLKKHLEDMHLEHASLISASKEDAKKIEGLHIKVGKLENEVKMLEKEIDRQNSIILDRAEEKREAIRQLCFAIDHFKQNYKHLQQVLSTVVQSQNRTAASQSVHPSV